MRHFLALMAVWLGLNLAVSAHQLTLTDEQDQPVLLVKLLPEWTALASADGLEITSADSRTRLHCLELRSCKNVEEAKVFLHSMRDTIYQSYQELSAEPIQFGGQPALRLRATGVSRGFDTAQDAIIFRTSNGLLCLVMLQQDVGYESHMPTLTELVTVP